MKSDDIERLEPNRYGGMEAAEGGRYTRTRDLLAVIQERDRLQAEVARLTGSSATLAGLAQAYRESSRLKDERDRLQAENARLREALGYCVQQVPELATVPGIRALLGEDANA